MVPFGSRHYKTKVIQTNSLDTCVPKQPYSILKMSFKNKRVELLHLPLILNHSFVNFSIPRKHPNFKVPYLIYKLEKWTWSKNSILTNLSVKLDTFVWDNFISRCYCADDSCFTDKNHGHVLTGNIYKLRKHFTKKPKHIDRVCP